MKLQSLSKQMSRQNETPRAEHVPRLNREASSSTLFEPQRASEFKNENDLRESERENVDELLRDLGRILINERSEWELAARHEKQRRILSLLAAGSILALSVAAPGVGRLAKYFLWEDSDKDDWKVFNRRYLRGAIKNLEKKKLIEIDVKDRIGEVRLTEEGKKRILRYSLDNLEIPKPEKWDGKWRVVLYDVLNGGTKVRDQFRGYLTAAGFYQFQESVYLHAFPCEREVEFLRRFLGIGQEVRFMVAEKIENDKLFRDYFAVR